MYLRHSALYYLILCVAVGHAYVEISIYYFDAKFYTTSTGGFIKAKTCGGLPVAGRGN